MQVQSVRTDLGVVVHTVQLFASPGVKGHGVEGHSLSITNVVDIRQESNKVGVVSAAGRPLLHTLILVKSERASQECSAQFQLCSTFLFGVKRLQRMSSISVKTPYYTLRSRLIAGIKDCEFVPLRFSG